MQKASKEHTAKHRLTFGSVLFLCKLLGEYNLDGVPDLRPTNYVTYVICYHVFLSSAHKYLKLSFLYILSDTLVCKDK